MTIMGSARDRCRLCFSMIGRERSICCQKSFHLFKPIERQKLPMRKLTSFSIPIRNRTVCFHDLLRRYLRTSINPLANSSNLICADCSVILLDVEQCAKYLRQTINQLKMKLNRSTRLRTSSLSATFQKKVQSEQSLTVPEEQYPTGSSSEFEDEDESDDDENQRKEIRSNDIQSRPTSTWNSSSTIDHGNDECNDPEEDEDGLVKASNSQSSDFSTRSDYFNTNGFPTKSHQENNNTNLFQLQLAQLMNSGVQNHVDSAVNTFAQMQRNILFQFFNDPVSAAAAAAAMSATPIKTGLSSSLPLLTSKMNVPLANNKQIGSGRKRKSTPEKRVIANHRTSTNNGDVSPTMEHDAGETNTTSKDVETFDFPLELTSKGHSKFNLSPVKSASQVQNLVMNSLLENGAGLYHSGSTPKEDRSESGMTNDSSISLSPSLIRRSTTPKRAKLSSNNNQFDPSKLISLTQTTDLLSPNHQTNLSDEINSTNQSKQARKLDPRSCIDCGKILFSDKTHLVHCQTHAKNEKQCWICGANDDDMKKHILTEHGNQKFTANGFKCQHCEKSFLIYDELQNHLHEHSKKKPFECPICHKRFGQQGNLSCHLRIHSGVKPFSCAHCGKAFRHSNSLRRHARTVHSASRGLSMSPRSMATSTTPGVLLSTAGTSNSMVAMPNDIHRLSTSDPYEDGPSGLLIASDEGESLQGLGSPSTGDPGSPQMDSDSPEPI